MIKRKEMINMKKIKCSVDWPWAGTDSDEEIIEVEDDATEDEINEIAHEALMEMVFNRVSTNWEEV